MGIDFVTLALARQYAKEVAGAGASEEQIAKLVEEYLAKNPIGQSDWNETNESSSAFVKNKTHYEEEISVVWDGDTDGKTSASSGFYYLVEDNEEKIKFIQESNSFFANWNNGLWNEENSLIHKFVFDNYLVFSFGEEIPEEFYRVTAFLILEDEVVTHYDDSISFPKKGLYVQFDDFYNEYISPFIAQKVHQLDPKFIPWPNKDEALALAMELDLVKPAGVDYNTAFVDENNRIFVL